MSKSPPVKPDFEALYEAAVETADGRTALLALIGNLSFTWSNNESMFIYLLMVLLDTDEVAAAIVFSTLNTTRARLDLVKRLAKARVSDKSIRRELDRLIVRFSATTALRNEFNHATYTVNDRGEITHTRSMKIFEKGDTMRFGETKPIDKKRIETLSTAIRRSRDLNRDLWDFLPKLKAHLDGTVKAQTGRVHLGENP